MAIEILLSPAIFKFEQRRFEMKPRVYIQVEKIVRAWGGWRLLGKIWGHPEIQDGHTALTSGIIESRRMRIGL